MELVKQKRGIVQYVRDRKRNPVGIVVVYKANSGLLKVGYSRCHKDDTFDRAAGYHTALQRAVDIGDVTPVYLQGVPHGFAKVISEAIDKGVQRILAAS